MTGLSGAMAAAAGARRDLWLADHRAADVGGDTARALHAEYGYPADFAAGGWSAAHLVVACGDVAAARFLAARGVALGLPDGAGKTPAVYARRLGHSRMVRFLTAAGVDVLAPDRHASPLGDAAAGAGGADMVAALLEAGADPAGLTEAALVAAERGNAPVLWAALDHPAYTPDRTRSVGMAALSRRRGGDGVFWGIYARRGVATFTAAERAKTQWDAKVHEVFVLVGVPRPRRPSSPATVLRVQLWAIAHAAPGVFELVFRHSAPGHFTSRIVELALDGRRRGGTSLPLETLASMRRHLTPWARGTFRRHYSLPEDSARLLAALACAARLEETGGPPLELWAHVILPLAW